jgi:4-hydroxy-tetrahydrodipicolinate synthase
MTLKLEGAMTALVTPFRDGKIDDRALAAIVEEQIAGGIDALVPAGTTGEAPTLTLEEQAHVVSVTVKQARGRVPIVAGAGSNSTHHAIELSRAAREAGADALLIVTPYYNKPTPDGVVRHFRAIADACPLPLVVYNVPTRTSSDVTADTIARLAEIPSVVAVKEATGLPARATQILARLGDRLSILSGDDFTMLPLYAVGARGVISVISNVAPRWVADMWDLAKAGDYARAREIHYKMWALLEHLFSETSPIPVKAAMAILGKCGDEIRAPLYPMAGAGREKLAALLQAAGLS